VSSGRGNFHSSQDFFPTIHLRVGIQTHLRCRETSATTSVGLILAEPAAKGGATRTFYSSSIALRRHKNDANYILKYSQSEDGVK
jgi:hypothetical protein